MDNIKEINLVKNYYGSEVTLYDERNKEHRFNLLLELSANNKNYAYFQSPEEELESDDGEIEVMEVVINKNNELELKFIDDDEWEEASEIFDIWTNKFE